MRSSHWSAASREIPSFRILAIKVVRTGRAWRRSTVDRTGSHGIGSRVRYSHDPRRHGSGSDRLRLPSPHSVRGYASPLMAYCCTCTAPRCRTQV